MGWSTRQLAELAGTTVKAIRHYHQIGLLDEPDRAANGYKQYGTSHLVRVLQITRMKEVGVPLAAISTMERADEDPEAAIEGCCQVVWSTAVLGCGKASHGEVGQGAMVCSVT